MNVELIEIYVKTETVFCKNGNSVTLYTDDCVEIDFVVSGKGTHCIADRSIPCDKGYVCVIKQGVSHSYLADDPLSRLEIRRILFIPSNVFEGKPAVPEHSRYCYGVFHDGTELSCATLNKETADKVTYLYDEIQRELECISVESQSAVYSYLTLLLITLCRYENSAIRNLQNLTVHERNLVLSVMRMVDEGFSSQSVTLESISAKLFVSKSHLSRLFKRSIGRSFAEHLRLVRMDNACRLLSETDLTVEEILHKCGLRDLNSFYVNFHNTIGMTPTQYRNKYNNILKNDEKGKKVMVMLSEISKALQSGRAPAVKEMVAKALEEGTEPTKILNEGLLDGMSIICEKFKKNEVYIPEVLVAARAMNVGVSVLKPYLVTENTAPVGKVCIGTVKGDQHDIGKNIVKLMMEGKGLEVIDLGIDVPAETFVETAITQNCQVICCSALLTTTMDEMDNVVKYAEQKGVRGNIKIMVGGAPVDEEFCKRINADCYTSDAASAADAALNLCKELLK